MSKGEQEEAMAKKEKVVCPACGGDTDGEDFGPTGEDIKWCTDCGYAFGVTPEGETYPVGDPG